MCLYTAILKAFPPGISLAFAYGSAVKRQAGRQDLAKLIDLVFCVPDARLPAWHDQNVDSHPRHYSVMGKAGGELITKYQRLSPGVYCNTLVQMDVGDRKVSLKYGVVAESDLAFDLLEWEHLYLAGRLHKPVVLLPMESKLPVRLESALSSNLSSALRTSLLLLPEKFSSEDLYRTITRLSYAGDFRMIFGENKKKVENIVEAQIDEFDRLYEPIVKSEEQAVRKINGDYTQDKSSQTSLYHLCRLPAAVKRIVESKIASGENANVEDKLRKLSESPDCGKVVASAVASIVWRSSIRQSLKNILSAGPLKSVLYAAEKAKKTFQR